MDGDPHASGAGFCANSWVENAFRTHHSRLIRYLTRIVGYAEAHDIASQVYLKMLTADPSSVRALWPWMRTVARHLAMDHLRVVAKTGPLPAGDESTTAVNSDPLDRIVVWDAIGRLSPDEQVAVAADMTGATGREIATLTSRTVHAAYCLLSRTRSKLRTMLEAAILPAVLVLNIVRGWKRRSVLSPVSMAAILAASFGCVLPSMSGTSPPATTAFKAIEMAAETHRRSESGSLMGRATSDRKEREPALDERSSPPVRIDVTIEEDPTAHLPRRHSVRIILDLPLAEPIGGPEIEGRQECGRSSALTDLTRGASGRSVFCTED